MKLKPSEERPMAPLFPLVRRSPQPKPKGSSPQPKPKGSSNQTPTSGVNPSDAVISVSVDAKVKSQQSTFFKNVSPLLDLKNVLVGGPLLRSSSPLTTSFDATVTPDVPSRPAESTFAPLLLEDPSSCASRYLLLTTNDCVRVLALQTGKQVAALLPLALKEDSKHTNKLRITSIAVGAFLSNARGSLLSSALANVGQQNHITETIVFVGCSDGTVREFAAADLERAITGSDPAAYGDRMCTLSNGTRIQGPCLRPRRILQMAKQHQAIQHIAVAGPLGHFQRDQRTSGSDSVVIYVLTKQQIVRKDKVKETTTPDVANNLKATLLRGTIPPMNATVGSRSKTVHRLNLHKSEEAGVKVIKTYEYASEAVYPFDLLTAKSPSSDKLFVLVASSTVLTFFLECLDKEKQEIVKYQPVLWTVPTKNSMTCVSVSSNHNDVACGHWSGEIRVIDNMLSIVYKYCKAVASSESSQTQRKAPKDSSPLLKHPMRSAIVRKLHWHAHPVASLCYDHGGSAGLLYSGGCESVLVTWQLARGTYRPAEVLPRVALGGIIHTLCCSSSSGSSSSSSDPSSVLLYCADNSLQLIASHNRTRIWQVQGLACAPSKSTPLDHLRHHQDATMIIHPKSLPSAPSLVISGSSHASGYLHWYDPMEQKVVSSLEVLPHNRVSWTEPGDTPLPVPTVTHAEFDSVGDILVTVDTVASENESIGAQQVLPGGERVGVISTLRFWSSGAGSSVYQLQAAMGFPHGKEHGVSALAVSPDGLYVCTVSNSEKAFRVWKRRTGKSAAATQGTAEHAMQWSCQYRVTFPAGYSNFDVGKASVAFSTDSSVLAIAFGNMITLWDRAGVRLLKTARHFEDSDPVIESVAFLNGSRSKDLLLTRSSAGIIVQTPFGKVGPNVGWKWRPSSNDSSVCSVNSICEKEVILVSEFDAAANQSSVYVLDAVSGSPVPGYDGIQKIQGKALALGATQKKQRSTRWTMNDKSVGIAPIYCLSDNGEIIAIRAASGSRSTGLPTISIGDGESTIPTLPLLESTLQEKRKRSRVSMGVSDLKERPEKKLALEMYGAPRGDDPDATALPTVELPRLRGAFTRAFLSRNLRQ